MESQDTAYLIGNRRLATATALFLAKQMSIVYTQLVEHRSTRLRTL
jgi:hypothetical protein